MAREKITSVARNNESFGRIDAAIGEQGAKLVFLLRLSPLIPFNLSNYFYGLTAVKFWPYVLASWIGMLPGTLLYVYLGTVGRAGLQAASGTDAGRSPLELDSSRRRPCGHCSGHCLGDKNRQQRPERVCREVIAAISELAVASTRGERVVVPLADRGNCCGFWILARECKECRPSFNDLRA